MMIKDSVFHNKAWQWVAGGFFTLGFIGMAYHSKAPDKIDSLYQKARILTLKDVVKKNSVFKAEDHQKEYMRHSFVYDSVGKVKGVLATFDLDQNGKLDCMGYFEKVSEKMGPYGITVITKKNAKYVITDKNEDGKPDYVYTDHDGDGKLEEKTRFEKWMK